MEIYQYFLTKNDCYIKNEWIKPTKIMLHSTACKGAPAKNFLSSWNKPMLPKDRKCVHAFLDPDRVYQTLPWTMRAWGCGGAGNDVAIQFEICEPKDYADKEYFLKVKETALELCLYLMEQYNISIDNVTSHCEAHREYGSKFASNHSDLDHWWKKYHNYTMDDFRMELKERMDNMLDGKIVAMITGLCNKYGTENIEKALARLTETFIDDGEPSGWAIKEIEEAKELGLTDGTRPEMYATRQEVSMMVLRGYKKALENK